MSVLESRPDGFGLVVIARAAWRCRQCFSEGGGEVTFG
jgi:hypothetical protein